MLIDRICFDKARTACCTQEVFAMYLFNLPKTNLSVK